MKVVENNDYRGKFKIIKKGQGVWIIFYNSERRIFILMLPSIDTAQALTEGLTNFLMAFYAKDIEDFDDCEEVLLSEKLNEEIDEILQKRLQ